MKTIITFRVVHANPRYSPTTPTSYRIVSDSVAGTMTREHQAPDGLGEPAWMQHDCPGLFGYIGTETVRTLLVERLLLRANHLGPSVNDIRTIDLGEIVEPTK